MMRQILLKRSFQEYLQRNHCDGFILNQFPWSGMKFPRFLSSLWGRSGMTSREICLGLRRQE